MNYKLTAEQHRNLTILHNRWLTDINPKSVYLNNWAEKSHCGTLACLGGWATTMPEFRNKIGLFPIDRKWQVDLRNIGEFNGTLWVRAIHDIEDDSFDVLRDMFGVPELFWTVGGHDEEDFDYEVQEWAAEQKNYLHEDSPHYDWALARMKYVLANCEVVG